MAARENQRGSLVNVRGTKVNGKENRDVPEGSRKRYRSPGMQKVQRDVVSNKISHNKEQYMQSMADRAQGENQTRVKETDQ